MAKRFTYNQELLPIKPGAVSQRLRVFIEDVQTDEQTLPADATVCQFKAGPEGARVRLVLDYLDEHGNDSGDAEDAFVVEDKVGPATPDGFGARTQIAEEEIPEPVI